MKFKKTLISSYTLTPLHSYTLKPLHLTFSHPYTLIPLHPYLISTNILATNILFCEKLLRVPILLTKALHKLNYDQRF
jgi:hypothetical protein